MARRIAEATPLLLGSGSPRRREILTTLGVPFIAFAAEADERVTEREEPDAYLERVVLAKLASVRASAPPALCARAPALLVADTVVIADGEILGKPANDNEALDMLRKLQGRTHEVHTRFVVEREDGLAYAETVCTRVTFRAIGDAEARAYVASGEGRDKAGAYAVQGLASAFVPRIEGSYGNVVGLPACEVRVALQELELF